MIARKFRNSNVTRTFQLKLSHKRKTFCIAHELSLMTSSTHISGAINRLSWFGSRLRSLEAFESVTLPYTGEHSHTSQEKERETQPVSHDGNSANFLVKKVKNGNNSRKHICCYILYERHRTTDKTEGDS